MTIENLSNKKLSQNTVRKKKVKTFPTESSELSHSIIGLVGDKLWILAKSKTIDALTVQEFEQPLAIEWNDNRIDFLNNVLSGFNLLENGDFGGKEEQSLANWLVNSPMQTMGAVDLSPEFSLAGGHTAFLLAHENALSRPTFCTQQKIPIIGDLEYFFSGYFATQRAEACVRVMFYDSQDKELGEQRIEIKENNDYFGGRDLNNYARFETIVMPIKEAHYAKIIIELGQQTDLTQENSYLFFTKLFFGVSVQNENFDVYDFYSAGAYKLSIDIFGGDWSHFGKVELSEKSKNIEQITIKNNGNVKVIDLVEMPLLHSLKKEFIKNTIMHKKTQGDSSESSYFHFDKSKINGGYFFDKILQCGNLLIFNGWAVNVSELIILNNNAAIEYDITYYDRYDLNEIDLSSEKSGFIVTLWIDNENMDVSLKITCCDIDKFFKPKFDFITVAELDNFPFFYEHELIKKINKTTKQWTRDYLIECGLDHVIYCKNVGLVAYGWRLSRLVDVEFFIGLEKKSVIIDNQSSINRPRTDLQNDHLNHWYGDANYEPGFATRLDYAFFREDISHQVFLGIKTKELPGIWLKSKDVYEVAPNPIALAKALFEIPETLPARWNQRMKTVDGVLIQRLLEQKSTALSPKVIIVGNAPMAPQISLVVPIYGRFDFVEHQLLGFSSDPDFKKGQYELIYVIDDPKLDEIAETSSEWLYELYQIPFKLIIGRGNRGFSGANNLGVQYATTQILMFLNSDVFVSYKNINWLNRLKMTLESSSNIGAVAPILIYPSGGIQHAGMSRFMSDYVGMEMNEHPRQGLNHMLISIDAPPYEVPMLTGACLMIRKTTFELIGGWDEGYLIGDFEDSDLCNELTKLNKKLLIDPSIRLWHLERQSIFGIGQCNFREAVTIFNGLRYMQKIGEGV